MSKPKPMHFWLPGPRYTWREAGKEHTAWLPTPKGNHMAARATGDFAQMYVRPRFKAADKALVSALLPLAPEIPFEAVRMDVAFVFVPPLKPAWFHEAALAGFVQCDRTGRSYGDRDNLHKLLADSMERAGFFANDATITQGDVRKEWGLERGYRIKLTPLHSVTRAEWKAIKLDMEAEKAFARRIVTGGRQ